MEITATGFKDGEKILFNMPCPERKERIFQLLLRRRTFFLEQNRLPFERMVNEMTREEELRKEGWEKRFTIDEPRLSEMVEQYKELGFEVLLEPVDTSSEECTTCIITFRDRYKTIYTRQKSNCEFTEEPT
jgi:hypothetical protein